MLAGAQGQPLPPEAWAFQFHNWTDAEADVYDCDGAFFVSVPPATKDERAPPPSGSGCKRTKGIIPNKDQLAALTGCNWNDFTAKEAKGKKTIIPLNWEGGCGMQVYDASKGFSPWAQASLGTPPGHGYWLCNTWLPHSAPPPPPTSGGWPLWVIALIVLCVLGGGGFLLYTHMKKN